MTAFGVTALGGVTRRHGGIVTQYQGDAVLASFNLPVADADHALKAVRASLEIQAMLGTQRFGPELALPTRIGIATGAVVGGAVGDAVRLGYTIHGEAVNFAARLQEANKHTGTVTLISPRTAELLNGQIPLRQLEPIDIPGVSGKARLYTPALSARDPNSRRAAV